MQPSYLKLYATGKLRQRAEQLYELLACCTLCPRHCKVNRLAGETGFCNTGTRAIVESYEPHFGEEAPLSGVAGSGTIFFSQCNLRCVFCQNYEISQGGAGVKVESTQLAAMMISLQKQGCHNINLVTPGHVIPQIVAALVLACQRGLKIPLVYNSSGYDSLEALLLLEDVVDIYMPDFKFSNPHSAKKFCRAADYPDIARQAISEMFRQVGVLKFDSQGLAVRGLLVRHLVMPGGLDEAREVFEFLATLSKDTYVNVMEQYYPCFHANAYPPLDKPLSHDDFEQARRAALESGLHRLEESGVDRLLARFLDGK
ncbi:MAG: radical SAM protein [Proteobacteria bacterium]|nr:radical SAM protein [Pseudomonadota bacterium]MBU1420557.1 radical SAM protein [Pseudomonadota bacterium]MBU1456120.1 radical SAM protein [Pseudomonadota bacterium]